MSTRHGSNSENRAGILRDEAHDLLYMILKLAPLTAKDRTNAK